ncbi:MAG: hypothetical protein IPL33_11195 [Sphingobacteriales bacterium]|nr:hypothetical protein [Sphingobacteriales bacterium]MCC7223312.1 hypothetical protein [Chitinophagales bacterium]
MKSVEFSVDKGKIERTEKQKYRQKRCHLSIFGSTFTRRNWQSGNFGNKFWSMLLGSKGATEMFRLFFLLNKNQTKSILQAIACNS